LPGKARIASLVSLILLSSLFLAACGNEATPTSPTNNSGPVTSSSFSGPTTTQPANPKIAPTSPALTAPPTSAVTTALPSETPSTRANDLIENIKMDGTGGKKGGQLVYTFANQFPAILQPYYSSLAVEGTVLRLMYATLIGQSPNSKYYPYLLADIPTLDNGDVKVSVSGDKMDVILKLKPGLKWSDGSALTSKDLAFTWKWLTDTDNSAVTIDLTSWQLISGIDTLNDTTAVLHFNQIFGPYLNLLTNFIPLPEKVWGKIDIKSDPSKSPESLKPTLVSGPFKVDDFLSDDRVVLSRSDNFSPVWGFNAYLDKIIVRNNSNTTEALAAVGKGELDEAENLDDNLSNAAAKVPNAHADIVQQYSQEYLQFNLSNPLLQDRRVRQALLQAIDRESLIKQFHTPKTVVLAVNFPPLSSFADKSLIPHKFDPELAKRLLDAAGWKVGGDSIRVKDGQKLSFTLSSTSSPIRVATAEVILSYWKAVGIEAKFKNYTNNELYGGWSEGGILTTGKYDIAMYGQNSDLDPDAVCYSSYLSSQIPISVNKGNGGNWGRLADKQLDQILEAQRATADLGKRIELFKQFQKIMYDNVYEAPLFSRVNNYVISNKVKNFKPNPTSDSNWWNAVELWLG
jgi:peptide/nickel transport system substrate-binding protein